MKAGQLIVYFIALLFLQTPNAQSPSLLSQIRTDSVLDVYITLDWNTLERKKKDKIYMPARVQMKSLDGDMVNLTAKVRSRGNMRLEICSRPPLKLKFSKEELAQHNLSALNELDLVNPCHNGILYEQLLLKEYLAYKLYEILAPVSFKAQLIRLHYLHADGSEENEPSYSFFVEDTEELVHRLGGKKYSADIISKDAIDQSVLLYVCLFEYMIGNTDWFLVNRHNMEFVIIPGYSLLVPVPYDFDYSGLVDAPYAAHHESIGLSSVRLRYYQGRCMPEEDLQRTIQSFLNKKSEILTACHQIPGLDDKSLKNVSSYLEEFFGILENPKRTQHQISAHCDRWPVSN